MAPNRQPEAEARSSSEEEEGSSEENEEQEESEAESEEEVDKTSTLAPKKPLVPKKPETTQVPLNPQSSSSDESGSESDSPSGNPRRTDKPIASKPVEEPAKATKKHRSKPSSATPASRSGTAAAKRQAENEATTNRESKKTKKKESDADGVVEEDTAKKTGDDPKKQLFQRLWSEDDEIVILEGMIEYAAKKGVDPVADMTDFHNFIKKSLHVDVTKTQLSDKVRRLKKKYENNASKGKKGGDRTFSKPHEQKAYELSKNIWGSEANSVGVESAKDNGKARKNQNKNADVASAKVDGLASPDRAKEGVRIEVETNAGVSRSFQFNRSIGESNLENMIIRDGLELVTGPKKSELEEKWKKLWVEEVELYLKRVELIRDQTKLVLEALKSSGV